MPHDEPREHHTPLAAVDAAIEAASKALLTAQNAAGWWEYGNPMGPRTTAIVMVVEHFLGVAKPEETAEMRTWIESWQREDGSFPAYIRADRGGLAMTGTCYAALVAAGGSADERNVRRAREYLLGNGGWKAVDPGTRLLLAMAGAIGPEELKGNYAFYFASKGALNAITKRFSAGATMFMMALGFVTARLSGGGGGFIHRRAAANAQDFLLSLQDPVNGSWFDLPLGTAWFVAALQGAGLGPGDPRIDKALRYIDGRKRDADRDGRPGKYVIAMDSDVWNTGLAVRALAESGLDQHEAAIKRGAAALRGMQQVDFDMHPLFQPKPDAPKRGGWAFTDDNHIQPDTDDTGVALAGLGQVLRAGQATDEDVLSINRGVEWLMGMQNPDGGWAAFAWNLPPKKAGPMNPNLLMHPPEGMLRRILLFIRKPPELGDPSTAGLTGRVLFALGELGFTWTDPTMMRAIDFLRDQQDPATGGWWGMWMVNYLPATACVVSGLASVGYFFDQAHPETPRIPPWVQRGIDFLFAHQRADGGWGEDPGSYLDPQSAGEGDQSMPGLTGLVLTALIDAGYQHDPRVQKGISYLVRVQADDGGWSNEEWLQVVLFPDTLYWNAAHPIVFPLEALAHYRDKLQGVRRSELDREGNPRGPALWTRAAFERWRHEIEPDEEAGRVVAALFEGGHVEKVNDLLDLITRVEDPIPENLPPLAQEYLAKTDEPPPWVDHDLLIEGELLFGSLAFAMVGSLFTASLPEAYCAANGAQVLGMTKRLERDVDNRIFETAQFLIDVMREGGLDVSAACAEGAHKHSPSGERRHRERGDGIRTAQKVRLMHAAVRYLILKNERGETWDEAWGKPINQMDMAGTLMTFSLVVLEAMRELRIELTSRQQEAYLHAWRVVGHYLGVDPELVPHNVSEGRILMQRIRLLEQAESEQGRRLMKVLLDGMHRNLPWIMFGMRRRLPATMVRHLIGPERARMLGVPRYPVTGWLFGKVMKRADQHGWFSAVPWVAQRDPRSALGRISFVARLNMYMVESLLRAKRGRKAGAIEFDLPTQLRPRPRRLGGR